MERLIMLCMILEDVMTYRQIEEVGTCGVYGR